MPGTYRIAVLPGDGIGQEVTTEAMNVLRAAAQSHKFDLKWATHAVGGAALDAFGEPLPAATLAACRAADAVLLGAIGGPQWDHEKGSRRAEAALLGLRKELQVYANLRPVEVADALAPSSPLKSERIIGANILLVRELLGGIYFGKPRINFGTAGHRHAINTMKYTEDEIARIAREAFKWARIRGEKVTSVDKANVLEVSQLWREVVTEVQAREYREIELEHLYVDNAAMQLVLRPKSFNIILTSNLFGDILSDLAATLPGSLGLLPSASVGPNIGLFEPVHGSAPDIAGQGVANPIGAIQSGAMMLDVLGEPAAARSIREGVSETLKAGVLTRDLGGTASTREVGQAVIKYAFE